MSPIALSLLILNEVFGLTPLPKLAKIPLIAYFSAEVLSACYYVYLKRVSSAPNLNLPKIDDNDYDHEAKNHKNPISYHTSPLDFIIRIFQDKKGFRGPISDVSCFFLSHSPNIIFLALIIYYC
jgi:hypothetical protein